MRHVDDSQSCRHFSQETPNKKRRTIRVLFSSPFSNDDGPHEEPAYHELAAPQ